MMIVNILYFWRLEISLMVHDWPKYKKHLGGNLMRLFPIMSVVVTGVLSIFQNEQPVHLSENGLLVAIEAVGMILLWIKFSYFLRIWDASNYLVRMIKEVIFDMGAFCLIFIIVHLAFAEVFFFVSADS